MKLKILFLPITLVLSLSILIWFAKPLWNEYQQKKVELEELRVQKEALDTGLRSLNNAMNAYETMDEDSRQLIKNALPNDKNNDDFIAEIHKNVVNSGVFLSGTTLKEYKSRRSSASRPKVEGEYVKKEKNGTQVDVDVVGTYPNIKLFVEKIDTQNRLSIPTKMVISTMDENSANQEGGEEEPASTDGSLIKAKISFVIYDKEADQTAQISKLNGMNDKVAKSLLTTGLKEQVVDQWRNSVTSTLFKPVTASGSGKQDLFAK